MSEDPQPDELGSRKWSILRAIVWDYVETAEPVGSETLVQRYHLGVGPATIRHEMAEMLDWGYLIQPHTSAGRVPSDTGYRYYVNRLPQPALPTPEERTRLKAIQRAGDDVELLLEESCKLLARLGEYVAIAATESNERISVKQVLLSPVGSHRVLLVLVLSTGHVENRLVELSAPIRPAELQRAGEHLSVAVAGRPVREVARMAVASPERLSAGTAALYTSACREVRDAARRLSRGKTIHGGLANMLSQPEFMRDVQALHQVLSLLDDDEALAGILDALGPEDNAVVIGTESGSGPMASCALVASRFYVGRSEAGTIGLLGPTRMRYEQSITLVRYTARLLSDTLTRLFES